MIVKLTNIINPNMALELLPWLAALLVKVWTEPNLFQVRLVRVACEDLFYGHFLLACAVDAKPDHAKTTAAKQGYALELLGKPVTELLVLLWGQVYSHVKPVLIPLVHLYRCLLVPINVDAWLTLWAQPLMVSLSWIRSLQLLWFRHFLLLKIRLQVLS